MSFVWTDDYVEQLRSMWRKGFTARQIAEKIGGVTRNAVIGKAHRLGLSQRPQQVKRKNVIAVPLRYEKVCQWPFGNPGEQEFHFCGSKVLAGKPYCKSHSQMAYRSMNIEDAVAEAHHETVIVPKEVMAK